MSKSTSRGSRPGDLDPREERLREGCRERDSERERKGVQMLARRFGPSALTQRRRPSKADIDVDEWKE